MFESQDLTENLKEQTFTLGTADQAPVWTQHYGDRSGNVVIPLIITSAQSKWQLQISSKTTGGFFCAR